MAGKSTLAMALTAPGVLEKISLPLPDIDGGSALLRIEACGICGTDCEQFATGMNLPMPHIKPVAGFISDKVVFKEIRLLGAFGVTASGYRSAIELIEAGSCPSAAWRL